MLVRIVKDWKWPDIFQQTPRNKGVWEGIRFTEEEVKTCDLLVIKCFPRQNKYYLSYRRTVAFSARIADRPLPILFKDSSLL